MTLEVLPVIRKRFKVTEVLSNKHHVQSCYGIDQTDQKKVSIKLIRADVLTSENRMLVKMAGSLASHSCPNSALSIAQGQHENWFYIIRSYIEGETLAARLATGSYSVIDSVVLAIDLLETLHKTHLAGIFHNNLKPSNVILHDQQCTLVDFGFSRFSHIESSLRNIPLSAIRYKAPEQEGLIAHGVGSWSDIYSVGVILYEALAGQPLFADAQTAADLLSQQSGSLIPTLRSIGVPVPRLLDQLIHRMLYKDPNERYQSAWAAITDLKKLLALMEGGDADPNVVIGIEDHRNHLTPPSFVGRQKEIARLRSVLKNARNHGGEILLLEAESGVGKSRLLEELEQLALPLNIWTLSGHAEAQTAHRPFQLLRGIVDGLVARAASDAAWLQSFSDKLGEDQDNVCAVFPQLSELLENTNLGRLGPEEHMEARNLAALSALLDSLGTAERPALLLLDDCQWADPMTLKILASWQDSHKRSKFTDSNTIVVLSFRTEEVDSEHLLRGLTPLEHIVLEQLSPAEIQHFINSMAGILPQSVFEIASKLGQGHPFMTEALIRGMVECGALVNKNGEWDVDPGAMLDVQSSRHTAIFLGRRLDLLSSTTLDLLSVGAVLGKYHDLETVASLTSRSLEQAKLDLAMASKRHIIWLKQQAGRTYCIFVHDKLRETCLQRLSDAERVSIHAQAAKHLEEHAPDNVFEIAFHLDEAGLSDRALAYALRAADIARSQQATEVALQHYRIAYRGSESADRGTRKVVAEGLGDMLMLQGDYGDAALLLSEAESLADSRAEKAEIAAKLGDLAFKQGDLQSADRDLTRGLKLLQRYVPRTSFVTFLLLLWHILVQICHTWLPGVFLAKRALSQAGEDLISVRLYTLLGYVYWFSRGPIPTLWCSLAGMNTAEKYPPTSELGLAYSGHVAGMSMLAMIPRALRYAKRSYDIRKELRDLWGQGQSLYFYGMAFYNGGQFEKAKTVLQQGIKLMKRSGDQWQINTARYHLGLAEYQLGELSSAIKTSQEIYKNGITIGDRFASGASLNIWSKASLGRVPSEQLQIELQRDTKDQQREAEVFQAEGIRLLGANNPVDASRRFRESWRKVKDGKLRTSYIASIPLWLALSLRIQMQQLPHIERKMRNRLLKEAKTAVYAGRRLAFWFQNERPFALRELALFLAMKGKIRRAHRLLNKSLHWARHLEARFEEAQTRMARGRLGLGLGWPGAAEDVRQAHEQLEGMGFRSSDWNEFVFFSVKQADERPATLSLAQRFDAVVDEGRSIAAALTREEIYAAVRRASMNLLRAEQCLIIEVQEGQQVLFQQHSSSNEEIYDWGQVNQCLMTGKVLCFSSAEEEQTEVVERMALAGVKSALAVPVQVRGKTRCCLYITHKQVAGIFDDEEERLGAYLATLTGAALENAEGFARIQGFSRSLEQRVRERTAELEHAKGQLEDSVFQLQEANRARNDFFTNISHELRTPLTLIIAPLDEIELQAKERGEAILLSTVKIIRRNAQSLLCQVDDILDFARMDAGRMPLIPEVLELVQFIEAVVVSVDPLAQRRSITLKMDKPEEPVEITGDAKLLRRVILNILVNAVKYINEGDDITVTLTADPGRAVIEIQDTGPGIPAAVQGRAFERFQRLSDGAGRSVAGSGIGLAMVREIVELHHGQIELESEEGQGACFRITLPQGEALAQMGGAAAAMRGGAGEAEQAGSRDEGAEELRRLLAEADIMERQPVDPGDEEARERYGRVLLVEDNLEMKQFLTGILSREFQVLDAENGHVGLEIARREVPEVIVSDVMMPLMDGYELCRRLKSDPQTHNIPLILVSARHGIEAALEGFSAGADDYITKPFSSPELLARVEAQLRIRTLGTALLRADKQVTLGLMSAGIAHEVLNPTNVIVNGVPILRQLVTTLAGDERYADEVKGLESILGAMEQSGDRIQKTVKAILTFARQRDDYLELQSMQLSEGVESILTILSYRLSKGCQVHRDYRWDEPMMCYPELLQQVIMNLITNALDAIDGEGNVFVSSERQEDTVVIRVRDDGPGISPQDRERIFAPYFTSKAPGEGTGLGLALSREIITLHQGALDLAPAGEAGAEFVITLPFIELTSEASLRSEQRAAAASTIN